MTISEDKLTRGERIRNAIRPNEWPVMRQQAELVEAWLKEAREDTH